MKDRKPEGGDSRSQELDEETLHQGPANHWHGWEARGGRLFLQESCLIFRTNEGNFQRDSVWIPLEEIEEVRAVNTFLLVPNGLLVRTREEEHRFVVWGRGEWVERIRGRMAATGTIPG